MLPRSNVRCGSIATEMGVRPTSAFPPIATKLLTSLEVGFVPLPTITPLLRALEIRVVLYASCKRDVPKSL